MKWKTVKIHEKDLLPFTPQQTNFPYLYAVVQRAKTQEYMCLVEANSLAHKELYLCHIGKKPLTWVRLCSPPFPLLAHSAFLDLLVAFGGCNDIPALTISSFEYGDIDLEASLSATHRSAVTNSDVRGSGGPFLQPHLYPGAGPKNVQHS